MHFKIISMKRIIIITVYFLINISLFAQIPAGYYNGTEGLTGENLKQKLNDIIKGHNEQSYTYLKTILKNSDEDPNNSNNVILLYTGRSQSKSSFGGGSNDWNREHVWAKSHGDFGDNPPCGTDAHHIRPTDASVNSDRGNLDFDDGGTQHSEATGCYYDGNSWEPRDEVKGDVARMLFYMAVRYEGENGEPDLELADEVNTSPQPLHGKMSTLLAWHEQDPPDDFERNRNDVVYSYQNNRNPFIDHPEFVNYLWGSSQDIPFFLSTPNGLANVDVQYSYDISAEDGNANQMYFGTTNLPSWLSFTDNLNNTATMVGTPSINDLGFQAVDIFVTNNISDTVFQSFVIQVINSNSIENTEIEKLRFYPNPANNFINIDFNVNKSDSYQLNVYNANGTLIKQVNLENKKDAENIDISDLKKGVYLIKMFSENSVLFNKLIIL